LKKLIGLALMALAIIMVVGTVAPAQINLYNREAKATVVTDQNGLLILRGIGPYREIINFDVDGKMSIDFNDLPMAPFAPYADGPNPDGTFKLTEVFALQNSGPEAYTITISSDNARVKFWLDGTGQWWGDVSPTQTLVKGPLASGSTLEIGLFLDTTGLGSGDVITAMITISAVNP
jgi:hypothetical protein